MSDTITIPTSVIAKFQAAATVFSMTALVASMGEREGIYKDLFKKINEPEIGDLVIELSSYWPSSEDGNPNVIGHLLHKEDPEARGNVKILTLDGREVNWSNCRFMGLPRRLVNRETSD